MKTLRRYFLVVFFSVTIFLCVLTVYTYVSFAYVISSKDRLADYNDTGIELFDVKNRPFFVLYNARFKKEVPLSQIPLLTQQAMIASEDKDFYHHPGFSIPALLRSFISNIQSKSLSYGGSTITQQLIKNSLLYSRKDFLRKYQEIVLASEIERRYSKDEILEMYLNSVYFGEGAYGIEEASHIYFSKHAQDLTLAQSAVLAGVLPSPSKLSLAGRDLKEAKTKQKIVLEKMVKQGYISNEEKIQAENEDIGLNPSYSNANLLAHHFALMVRDQLVEKYGEDTVVYSGFKIRTTLNLDWQTYAEKSVARQVEKLKVNRATNGAAVVIDPITSEIRAMVGSIDWYDDSFGKVNLTTSLRPPGSAFKPIVYVKAFEKNIITPATILQDRPTSFANFDESTYYSSFPSQQAALQALRNDPGAYYKPVNYDRKFRGSVTVRRALANSLNVPAVSVMAKVGVNEALDSAQNLGITTLNDKSRYGLSLVLGAGEVKLLEMTNAYAVFANKGLRNEPVAILEIADKEGRVLYKYSSNPKPVIDEKYAFLISSILSDNKTRKEVFGNTLDISRPAAVKTGTTENYKDSWTIGYTPSLAVGVWVGNNYGEPMDGVAGSLGAAPIWKDLMEKFSEGTPVEQFTPPKGVIKASTNCAFDLSSKIASSSAVAEYFVEGTQPVCPTRIRVSTPSAYINPLLSR